MIQYTCHNCGAALQAPFEQVGHDLQCPNCNNMTIVPAAVAPQQPQPMPMANPVGASVSGIAVPVLISAISNLVFGLLWLVLTLGCAFPVSIALWVLCGFEFALYAKAQHMPRDRLGSQALTIGILEIIAGTALGSLPSLVCGIIVLVNSSQLRTQTVVMMNQQR